MSNEKVVEFVDGLGPSNETLEMAAKAVTQSPSSRLTDDIAKLAKLGSASTHYVYEIDPKQLEVFPNKAPGKDYFVELTFPEWTSLCPKTGQPDFGEIYVRYIPNELCLESKGLKLYFFSFRNSGMFMETIVNQIADDLAAACNPRALMVVGRFNPRGGISIVPTAFRGDRSLLGM